MKIIDADVHLDRVAGEDILRMAWSGARVGIVPTPHLMAGLFTSETVMQLWDKTWGIWRNMLPLWESSAA